MENTVDACRRVAEELPRVEEAAVECRDPSQNI